MLGDGTLKKCDSAVWIAELPLVCVCDNACTTEAEISHTGSARIHVHEFSRSFLCPILHAHVHVTLKGHGVQHIRRPTLMFALYITQGFLHAICIIQSPPAPSWLYIVSSRVKLGEPTTKVKVEPIYKLEVSMCRSGTLLFYILVSIAFLSERKVTNLSDAMVSSLSWEKGGLANKLSPSWITKRSVIWRCSKRALLTSWTRSWP